MTNFLNHIKQLAIVVVGALLFASCDEEDTFNKPIADFEIEGVKRTFDTVTFVNNSVDATSFLWHFGNGVTQNAVSPKYMYTEPGTYTISLQAEGAGGRSVMTKELVIAEGVPFPTAKFSIENEGVLLDGVPVVFVNESEAGESYLWEFGDSENSTSTEKDPIFTYTQAGEFTVTLTTTNEKGSESYSMDLTVLESNLGTIYFIHDDLDNNRFYLNKVDIRTGVMDTVTEISGFTIGLEYDPVDNLLYYANDDDLKIYSNTLTGDNEQEVASGFRSVRDIAIDSEFGYLYVADDDSSAIFEIDLSDLSKNVLYDATDFGLKSRPIGIHYSSDELYITCVELDAESVWRGNVFGDGVTNLIDYNSGGFGYCVTVDDVNNKIYFNDHERRNISNSNLDGSEITTVVPVNTRVYGIEVDTEFGKLYWSDISGVIQVSNLDGTGVITLVEGLSEIRGIVLVK